MSTFDWGDLAGRVIGLGAPILGGALGGPFGAAAAKILADSLGVAEPTPAAVGAVLDENPNAAAAAQQAESEWLTALAEIGRAQVAEVGATQRMEIASGDPIQRRWRPLYALELSLFECRAFAITVLHALWTGHDTGINGFVSLTALFMAYFGARFGVLGVYVTGRTREKQTNTTGELPPSLIGELIKVLANKKK